VEYDINRNPSFPRWFATSDPELTISLTSFREKTEVYYEADLIRTYDRAGIVNNLIRMVGCKGVAISSTGFTFYF
jgi:hypothetical protein